MIINRKKILETIKLFEAKADQDFLFFVVKWFSENENDWKNEWEFVGCYANQAQCICGKEGLETVFIIRNKLNKTVLSPIGSICIKNFGKAIGTPSIIDNLKNGLIAYLNRNTIFFKRNIAVTTEFFTKENIQTFLDFNLITEDDLKLCLRALNKRYATVDEYQKGASIILNKVIQPLKKSLYEEIESSKVPSNSVYFTQDQRELMKFIYDNFYHGKMMSAKDSRKAIEKLFPKNMLNIS